MATSRLSLDYILCIFLDKWAAHDPMSLKKLVLIQGYCHESFFRYKVCRDMVISMVLRRETSLWPATIWIPCRRIFRAYSISRWRRVSRVARRLLRLMRLPSSPRSSESPCSQVIDKLEIVCTFAKICDVYLVTGNRHFSPKLKCLFCCSRKMSVPSCSICKLELTQVPAP